MNTAPGAHLFYVLGSLRIQSMYWCIFGICSWNVVLNMMPAYLTQYIPPDY